MTLMESCKFLDLLVTIASAMEEPPLGAEKMAKMDEGSSSSSESESESDQESNKENESNAIASDEGEQEEDAPEKDGTAKEYIAKPKMEVKRIYDFNEWNTLLLEIYYYLMLGRRSDVLVGAMRVGRQ